MPGACIWQSCPKNSAYSLGGRSVVSHTLFTDRNLRSQVLKVEGLRMLASEGIFLTTMLYQILDPSYSLFSVCDNVTISPHSSWLSLSVL